MLNGQQPRVCLGNTHQSIRHSSRSATTGTGARPCGRVRSRRTTWAWSLK